MNEQEIKSLKDSLFYPDATEWMWNYCIFLGSYVASNGEKYDLGIYVGNKHSEASAAIVYDNQAGKYLSGELDVFGQTTDPARIGVTEEIYEETRRRAKNLCFYNGKMNESVFLK